METKNLIIYSWWD